MKNLDYICVNGKTGCIEYIAAKLGLKKQDVGNVIEAEAEYIEKCLCSGLGFRLNGLGTFKFKTIKPREEKVSHNFLTGKDDFLPFRDTHSRVKFTPSPKLQKKISEISMGHPFSLGENTIENEKSLDDGDEADG